jgi:predicted ester cyclase
MRVGTDSRFFIRVLPCNRGRRKMSTEENKALARRFMKEIVNEGNLEAIDELFDRDFVNHFPPPGTTPDRQGFKKHMSDIHSSFTRIRYVTEDLISENDKVVIRGTFKAISKGGFRGATAVDREVIMTFTVILRFESGKIVERWGNADELGLLTQLGVIPEMGEN